MYLIRDLHPEHIKNSPNSVIKRQLNLKWANYLNRYFFMKDAQQIFLHERCGWEAHEKMFSRVIRETQINEDWGCGSVVKYVPQMFKALGFITSTGKKKKKKKTTRCHFSALPPEWLESKSQRIRNSEDVEKSEPSNTKWYSHFGNSFTVPRNVEPGIIMWPCNSAPRNTPKRKFYIHVKTCI